MKIYLILFILVSFLSCNTESNLAFEQRVFDEVFLPAVDSTLIDMRIYTGFFKYSEKQRDSIRVDTLNRVVAFDEKIAGVDKSMGDDIPKNYQAVSDSVWMLNVEKHTTANYIFKPYSELPGDFELIEWKKKYPKFVGSLKFSKIYFDTEQTNGMFTVSYHCGPKCGRGYLVYIEKENDTWKIVKVEDTWIS